MCCYVCALLDYVCMVRLILTVSCVSAAVVKRTPKDHTARAAPATPSQSKAQPMPQVALDSGSALARVGRVERFRRRTFPRRMPRTP